MTRTHREVCQIFYQKRLCAFKAGQRWLTWPVRKDDTRSSRSVGDLFGSSLFFLSVRSVFFSRGLSFYSVSLLSCPLPSLARLLRSLSCFRESPHPSPLLSLSACLPLSPGGFWVWANVSFWMESCRSEWNARCFFRVRWWLVRCGLSWFRAKGRLGSGFRACAVAVLELRCPACVSEPRFSALGAGRSG